MSNHIRRTLLRGMADIVTDLYGEPSAPAPAAEAPASVADTPAAQPVYTPKPALPPFSELWKTADEAIDWTGALASPTPTDPLIPADMWARYHDLAADVLRGDTAAYLDALEIAAPMADLTPFVASLDVEAVSADALRGIFTPRADLLADEPQRYLSGMALRIARDLFAVLPVTQVEVAAMQGDAALLTVSFERAELNKVRFAFVDPVDFVAACGGRWQPDFRQGKGAQSVLAQQQPDGTWPGGFHGLARPGAKPLTTEQALRRLHALGFTIADAPIRRCVDTMSACLRGERKIDAYWESGIDWAMFEPLMLAAWIRRFDPAQPDALSLARRWANVAEAGFAAGAYDESAWNTAYEAEFHRAARHPRPVGFCAMYHAMLLPGLLRAETECAFVRHILHTGMYYVHERPLIPPPAGLAARDASQWLAALELLADFPHARAALDFAAAFLRMSAAPDGTWDFGPAAKDGVFFPLADSWRTADLRKADCTARVLRFLDQIG